MSYDFKNVNVLVVECSTSMFQLIKSVLNMLTIPPENIDDSYDPEDAFIKFRAMKHDLIITDWLENPDNGIKLTEMIRTRQDSPNNAVPVIMTAGTGHKNRVLKARDTGITDYVVKPFSAKIMADRLANVIEDRRNFVISENFNGPDRRNKKRDDYDGPERRNTDNFYI